MKIVDSDVVIDWIRKREPGYSFVENSGELAISCFTYSEIICGCSSGAHQRRDIKNLARFAVVYPTPSALSHANKLLVKLFLSSGLGLVDAYIAATAWESDFTLVTKNAKHFKGASIKYETLRETRNLD